MGEVYEAKQEPQPVMAARVPRVQRRPMVVVAGVLLILLGAAGGALAFWSIGDTVEAVAARVSIERGQVMSADDFVTVQINPVPELQFIGADGLDDLVGHRAAHDIAAGSLVDLGAAASVMVPGDGFAVVGLSLAPGTEPGADLVVGDRVRIVLVEPSYDCATAAAEAEAACEGALLEIAGEVAAVDRDTASGQLSLAVMVAEQDAGIASAAAALGRVAVVLDSRDR